MHDGDDANEFLDALEFGRFYNLPEHSKRFARRRKDLYVHLLDVSRPFTTTYSTRQIKSTRKATVAFDRGLMALLNKALHG